MCYKHKKCYDSSSRGPSSSHRPSLLDLPEVSSFVNIQSEVLLLSHCCVDVVVVIVEDAFLLRYSQSRNRPCTAGCVVPRDKAIYMAAVCTLVSLLEGPTSWV